MEKLYYHYIITNNINMKVYVGLTTNPVKRWYEHCRLAKVNPIYPIHLAINKYGVENFSFEIISGSKSHNEANEIEVLLIRQYNSLISGNGYNVALGGNSPTEGRTLSEEHKQKLSVAHKGKKHSEEYKQMMSVKMKGMNTWTKGVEKGPRSEVTKQKIREGNLGNTNSLGHVVTNETRQKIREKNVGQQPTQFCKDNALKITKGRTWKLVDGKRVWMDKESK
jgi:group I intron endonuclease